MPGLSGLITSAPERDLARALERMRSTQTLPGIELESKEYSDRNCGLLLTSPALLPGSERQPARSIDHVLFVEGEVFEISKESVAGQGNLANILLAHYLDNRDGFPDTLNGEFSIAIYERRARKLILYSDHLSSRPLFYWHGDGEVVFGSEKKAILSVLRRSPIVDELGLLQLFAHEHNVGDRTFIKGIKRLPPGSRLIFENNKLTVRKWSSMEFGARSEISYSDAVEEARAELKQATIRRIQPGRRVVLTLSGGLDSRAIAAAIPRDHRPLPAVTLSADGVAENIVATKIADRLEMDHHRVDPSQVDLSRLAPLVAWRTEGETTLRNALGTAHHGTLKGLGDFVAGGWLAECTSGQIVAPFMLIPASPHRFLEKCYRYRLRYDWNILGQVFSSDFLSRNTDGLRDAFMESWKDIPGETNIDRYHGWYMTNRAIRMTNSSMPVDSHLFEKIRPFYDRSYLQTVAAFPWQLKVGQLFYRALIYEMAPEIRDIPESQHGCLLYRSQMRNSVSLMASFASWAAAKFRRPLQRQTAYPDAPDGAISPGALVRNDPTLRATIEQFLSSPMCDDGIFNTAGIRRLLAQHYDDGIDHAELILYLAVVHRALEYLIWCQPTHCPVDLTGRDGRGALANSPPADGLDDVYEWQPRRARR